jgi:hypothetical protein
MVRSIRDDDLSNPDRLLSNLINDYVEGELDREPPIQRAVVLGIDHVGGQFSDDEDAPNPKNSIRARLLDGSSEIEEEEDLPVFWPLFPYDIMPIKESEHVFVMFEDPEKRSGIWISRIPQPSNVDGTPIDNRNIVPGTKQYEEDTSNDFSQLGAEQAIQNLEEDPGIALLSPDFVVENPSPMFRARVGDRVIEGSNNTIIVLGRDRPTTVEDEGTQRESAGTIDVVAGRKDDENMNMDTDSSRIYVSMLTDADSNIPELGGIGTPAGPSATIAIKSDEIRVVARKGMKIVVDGGDMFINAQNVTIGNGSSDEEPMVLGNKLNQILTTILTALIAHTHPTSVGPSGPSVDQSSTWSSELSKLGPDATGLNLSKTVKVKP